MRLIKILAKLLLAMVATVLGASLASALAAVVMRPRLADRAAPADDEVELAVVYGSRQFRSEASSFRGGRIVCWYSGMDVDLRAATLDPGGADVEAWTVFGGTRIRVPEDWRVTLHGIAVFGGAGRMTPAGDELADGPELRVRHRTVFGGFGVWAEPDEEVLAV